MRENEKKSLGRTPEPSTGPDEEGEIPLEPDHIPGSDSGAWVKFRTKKMQDTKKPRPDKGRGS